MHTCAYMAPCVEAHYSLDHIKWRAVTTQRYEEEANPSTDRSSSYRITSAVENMVDKQCPRQPNTAFNTWRASSFVSSNLINAQFAWHFACCSLVAKWDILSLSLHAHELAQQHRDEEGRHLNQPPFPKCWESCGQWPSKTGSNLSQTTKQH